MINHIGKCSDRMLNSSAYIFKHQEINNPLYLLSVRCNTNSLPSILHMQIYLNLLSIINSRW